jgi:hypothetical protein
MDCHGAHGHPQWVRGGDGSRDERIAALEWRVRAPTDGGGRRPGRRPGRVRDSRSSPAVHSSVTTSGTCNVTVVTQAGRSAV